MPPHATAVLTLATGANTLIFSVFQGRFLRPAASVPDDPAHALVWMQERPAPTARWDLIDLTGTQLGQLAERRETFASVAAWVEEYVIIAGGDSAGAQNAPVTFVTPNFFTTLGVPTTRGRDLRPETDGIADLGATRGAGRSRAGAARGVARPTASCGTPASC